MRAVDDRGDPPSDADADDTLYWLRVAQALVDKCLFQLGAQTESAPCCFCPPVLQRLNIVWLAIANSWITR